MRISVNDEPTDLAEGSSVRDLLNHLKLPGTRVAIEVNREILRLVRPPRQLVEIVRRPATIWLNW